MKTITRLIIPLVLLALGLQAVESKPAKPIHPLAFKSVICWLSDSVEPVVTGFSIDAIEKNGNQFDYSQVTTDGNKVKYTPKNSKEMMGYTIESKGNLKVIKFWYSSGGTLVSQYTILGEIKKKTIGKKTIRVFDVVDFKDD